MEEAQYRLNRIRDEMDYYLVTMPPAELEKERLKPVLYRPTGRLERRKPTLD
jgi:hypothetical protein